MRKPLSIRITTNENLVISQAEEALAKDSELFTRGRCLVDVICDEPAGTKFTRSPHAPCIRPTPFARIRELLSESALWFMPRSREAKHPPRWVIEGLMSRARWPLIRPLEGVVESPVLRPDGSILDTKGYDSETGLLFLPNATYEVVPPKPDRDAAIRAKNALLEVVSDFQFEHPCHRSGWLAAVLVLLARHAIMGSVPLHLIDANVRGAGKSLLASAIVAIGHGREAARMVQATNDEEQRKCITSLLMAGSTVALIDNISKRFGTSALDAALTGNEWQDRKLGGNTVLRLPNRLIWLATGNNVELQGDLNRRCLSIRLNSPEEYPEQRAGFQHPNLMEWIRIQRPRLVGAALTMLRAFFVAGCPSQGLKHWGSFEQWSAIVRETIVWCDEPDPGESRVALQESGDSERDLLDRLLTGWVLASEALGRKSLGATDIVALWDQGHDTGGRDLDSFRLAVAELCGLGPGKPPGTRILGYRLRRFRDRVCNGRRLIGGPRGSGGNSWSVEKV